MMIEQEFTTRRLIVGCGYLGGRIGRIWAAAGNQVYALTRKLKRFEGMRAEGWSPLHGDLCGSLPEWPEVDTALLAVGFDRTGQNSIEQVYVDGVQRLIETLPNSLSKLIYISSTGVFGAGSGDLLDESSPCLPDRPGGAACLAAEKLLRKSRFAERTIILRLAGIYGPGRIPRLAQLTDRKPIPANPTGQLNLIQVDDAANIVTYAADSIPAPDLFCVSDGQPCARGDFLRYTAELLELPAPTFTEISDPTSRRGSDKRINASKIHSQVARPLRYPSYREGLAAAVRESPSPSSGKPNT